MNEEFKQLMLFHCMCGEPLNYDGGYLAVDESGVMWWYKDKPCIVSSNNYWTNIAMITFDNEGKESAIRVSDIQSRCEFWKDTLIEL